MTISPQSIGEAGHDTLADLARDHLWMHFTRHSTYAEGGHVPVIVRGEGAYIYDDQGKRYLDGLAGLFVVRWAMAARNCRCRGDVGLELAFFRWGHRIARRVRHDPILTRDLHISPGNAGNRPRLQTGQAY
jgi:hypothetical protein